MDPRISRWAKTLVGYCLEVQPGQIVLINATPAAELLVAEVYRETLRAGGHPVLRLSLPALTEISLREGNEDQLSWINPAERLLLEQADATLAIGSETNTRNLAEADPERLSIMRRANRELAQIRSQRSVKGDIRWCLTLFPTNAYAQDAGMSLSDFQEFV